MSLKELYDECYIEYLQGCALVGNDSDNYDNAQVCKIVSTKDYHSIYNTDQDRIVRRIKTFRHLCDLIKDNRPMQQMVADYLDTYLLYSRITKVDTGALKKLSDELRDPVSWQATVDILAQCVTGEEHDPLCILACRV